MKKFLLALGLLACSPFYVTEVSAQGRQNGDVEECPICCEDIKSYERLVRKCGHEFCVNCWYRNIHGEKKRACPMCRQETEISYAADAPGANQVIKMVREEFGKDAMLLHMAIIDNKLDSFEDIMQKLTLLKEFAENPNSTLRGAARGQIEELLNSRSVFFGNKNAFELAEESTNRYFADRLRKFSAYGE